MSTQTTLAHRYGTLVWIVTIGLPELVLVPIMFFDCILALAFAHLAPMVLAIGAIPFAA